MSDQPGMFGPALKDFRESLEDGVSAGGAASLNEELTNLAIEELLPVGAKEFIRSSPVLDTAAQGFLPAVLLFAFHNVELPGSDIGVALCKQAVRGSAAIKTKELKDHLKPILLKVLKQARNSREAAAILAASTNGAQTLDDLIEELGEHKEAAPVPANN